MARRGFTLVEVLMAALLVAVAVTAVMGGLRALSAAEDKSAHAALLQRLAAAKGNEVMASTDPSSFGDGGDFSDRGHAEVSWTLDVETSGATNVDQITITAEMGAESQALTFLQYVRPQTGTVQ